MARPSHMAAARLNRRMNGALRVGERFAKVSVRGNPMANEGYHEPIEKLRPQTLDMHRAITSLMEELEAVDWYNQRVDACTDQELKRILEHNRDEEKEHAVMTLEWIRRRDPAFDEQLKEALFKTGPITGEH